MFFFVLFSMKMILILMSVAFYTLMERKVLSYTQTRKGPNKTSYLGVLQPFSDALKLLTKTETKLIFSNSLIYTSAPFYSFFLFFAMFLVWSNFESSMSFLFVLLVIAVSVYGNVMSGWTSNSKFSLLGSMRALAQSISYEITLSLSLIFMLLLTQNLDVSKTMQTKSLLSLSLFSSFVFIIFFLSLICELNRAPFDTAEGESELVSGFNTEYSGIKFALIFLSEYGMMIFTCILSQILFFNSAMNNQYFTIVLFMLIVIWIRSCYPRLRYDLIMKLTWKNLLSLLVYLSLFYLCIL